MKILKLSKEEIVIGLLAIGTYLVCLVNNFHTDDWIVLNLLRDGFSFSDFVSMENAGRFRPLTNVIIYLRYLAFGDTPAYYYALNIFLHAIVSVFLYRLLLKIKLPEKAALISAIIFAVYFQHYEAVLWLYGIIRELAAIAYMLGIWHLYDFVTEKRKRSFWLFAIISFLGLFIVEDFVVAPAVFFVFAFLFFHKEDRRTLLAPVAIAGIIELAVYFTIRSMIIVRPGIMEDYYYPGFHMIRVLFEYMGWFVIPSPAHPYFVPVSSKLPAIVYFLWRGISYLAIWGFIPFSIWLYLKSPKQVRFFILFVFVSMLPIIPLNYKVSSRNIYLPSMGLAVIGGYLTYRLIWISKIRMWLKRLVLVIMLAYLGISVVAVVIASREYHETQILVAGIVDDLQKSGEVLNNYDYVLLDHVPGRAIIGPAMIYRLHFRRSLVASNDPISGPIDIGRVADSLDIKGVPIIVYDYRDDHMVEATDEYIGRGR